MNRMAKQVAWTAIGLLAAAAARGAEAPPPAAKAAPPEAKAPPPEVKAPPADFTVDREKREILIPCRIAPRKLPTLPEIYPIEVIATFPTPQGQKAHETVVTLTARPSEIHKALEGFGLKAGRPARGDEWAASGPELEVLLELPGKGGAKTRSRIESLLVDRRTGKPLPPLAWRFTGSTFKQPDPAKPDRIYAADVSGTLISLFPVTDENVVQSNLTMRDGDLLKVESAKDLVPPEGTPAVLILRPAPPAAGRPPAAARPPAPAAAEASILDAIRGQSLAPARTGSINLPAIPPAAVPDAFRGRRDAAPSGPAPAEALPAAPPFPPLPREIPAPK